MITKSSEIHNADRLIYAIIKCAVDDYKTELRGRVRLQGKGLYVNSSTEASLSLNISITLFRIQN